MGNELVELRLDNMRARFRRVGLGSYGRPMSLEGFRVYDQLGSYIFLPSDISTQLPAEKQHLAQGLEARLLRLQAVIPRMTLESMLALHDYFDRELAELSAVPKSRPRLIRDIRWLRERVQEVAEARLFRFHAYPLLDEDTFKVAIAHYAVDDTVVSEEICWPKWATFDPFVQQIEASHAHPTASPTDWPAIERWYVCLVDSVTLHSPHPVERLKAELYRTWLSKLEAERERWVFQIVDEDQPVPSAKD
ncbi:hypothetical protein CSOJ01_04076 [Colletotrichum sojae]|uniref:Uncharacterized protein n=1 Tax=Colletotrichum sojae TaxID=2175907 RepID=A0A8H6MZU0_9PEZI|nr:hypothetical protein CSOJ01_04076 [Colletotrichum sojae]